MKNTACRIVLALEDSVFAIQGPPGAGKTFTGARMICELVKAEKKIGVTALSHKVIRHLLEEVTDAKGINLKMENSENTFFGETRFGNSNEDEEGERHRRVAERVHHERLLGRCDRRRALLVEADQQVAREADHAPAGEQQKQRPALHQQQHREDEQRHVGEEAPFLVATVHVTD